MKKLTQTLFKLVLPQATAKASPLRARCHPGCGLDGVYYAARTPDGKLPCC
jgi:hypothetical protein